jgi:hypothetical protein
MKAGWKVEM